MIWPFKKSEPKDLLWRVRSWLGPSGVKFFRDLVQEDGTLLNHWMEGGNSVAEGGIPHIVHFREGMRVRNFLREQPECKDWDAHKLDEMWEPIILDAIKLD